MIDEYLKIVKQLETNRDLINEVIKDLRVATVAMDEYLKILKDPVKILTTENLGEELSKISNKMALYILMANNKMTSLNNFNESLDKEEK